MSFLMCSPTASCWFPRASSLASGDRWSFASMGWKDFRRSWPIRGPRQPGLSSLRVSIGRAGLYHLCPTKSVHRRNDFARSRHKANPLKKSLILRSSCRGTRPRSNGWPVCRWSIPSGSRSMGCLTAARRQCACQAIVPRYCLSICSADFNEWIWKNASSRSRYRYLGTPEYEMVEFDLGNTFNYAEMAAFISPRTFMVERGHHDGVAPDEWVAYESPKCAGNLPRSRFPSARRSNSRWAAHDSWRRRLRLFARALRWP